MRTYTDAQWAKIQNAHRLSNELISNYVKREAEEQEAKERQGCVHCGTTLGIDCGDAEPDFDDRHCSEGCYWEAQREVM